MPCRNRRKNQGGEHRRSLLSTPLQHRNGGAAAVLLVPLLISCSAGGRAGVVGGLQNRGPVALSDENPYLAGNVLVAEKAKESEIVRGFIKHRGVPPAVEVDKDFMAPARIKFYYPESREAYTLEEVPDGTAVISGPERMSQAKQKRLIQLTRSLQKAPVLREESEGAEAAAPVFEPLPTPGAPGASARGTAAPAPGLRPHATTETPGKPRPSAAPTPAGEAIEHREQQVIRELQQQGTQPLAETSPQGDLVHYVTFEGETLSMIARWYTHDRANVGRIIRMNKLKNPNKLSLGDVIVIPSYLVKNKTRLNEAAIEQLKVKR